MPFCYASLGFFPHLKGKNARVENVLKLYLNCVKRRFLMIKTCSSGPIAYILCCQSEGHISYRLEKFETISTQIDQIKLLLIDFILPAQFEGVY